MALNTNSYGHPDDIAALTPRWATSSAIFDSTTRPTLGQVQNWVNQVSAMVNAILSQYGFTIPVTQTDAVEMLNLFVNEEVAAMVEGVNGSGRFGPTTKAPGKRGRFAVITEDIIGFIEAIATGLEQMGVSRTYTFAEGAGYRGTDEDGNDIAPLFQRSAFGNEVIGA